MCQMVICTLKTTSTKERSIYVVKVTIVAVRGLATSKMETFCNARTYAHRTKKID